MTIYQKLKKLDDYVFQIGFILLFLFFLNSLFIEFLFKEIFLFTFLVYLVPVLSYLCLNILYDFIIEKINE